MKYDSPAPLATACLVLRNLVAGNEELQEAWGTTSGVLERSRRLLNLLQKLGSAQRRW